MGCAPHVTRSLRQSAPPGSDRATVASRSDRSSVRLRGLASGSQWRAPEFPALSSSTKCPGRSSAIRATRFAPGVPPASGEAGRSTSASQESSSPAARSPRRSATRSSAARDVPRSEVCSSRARAARPAWRTPSRSKARSSTCGPQSASPFVVGPFTARLPGCGDWFVVRFVVGPLTARPSPWRFVVRFVVGPLTARPSPWRFVVGPLTARLPGCGDWFVVGPFTARLPGCVDAP
jgi:hypothetical protein